MGSESFLDLVEDLESNFSFDYIIFDLSPSMTSFEKAALIFNEEIKGVDAIRKRLGKFTIIHKSLTLLNKVNESFKAHRTLKESLSKNEDYSLFILNQDQRISDSLFAKKFIKEYLTDKKNRKICFQ